VTVIFRERVFAGSRGENVGRIVKTDGRLRPRAFLVRGKWGIGVGHRSEWVGRLGPRTAFPFCIT